APGDQDDLVLAGVLPVGVAGGRRDDARAGVVVGDGVTGHGAGRGVSAEGDVEARAAGGVQGGAGADLPVGHGGEVESLGALADVPPLVLVGGLVVVVAVLVGADHAGARVGERDRATLDRARRAGVRVGGELHRVAGATARCAHVVRRPLDHRVVG